MSKERRLPDSEIHEAQEEEINAAGVETTEAEAAGAAKTADEERRRLEEENEALRKELQQMREKTVKERLYDHVHVSVRAMDIFIGVMVFLFIAVIVLGILNKGL